MRSILWSKCRKGPLDGDTQLFKTIIDYLLVVSQESRGNLSFTQTWKAAQPIRVKSERRSEFREDVLHVVLIGRSDPS